MRAGPKPDLPEVSEPGVNPRNMMPAVGQAPAPGQKTQLSTSREMSTIPKTGSEQTWEYPSAQQFFNASRLKGKEMEEDAMDAVIFAHNTVNEESWERILEWERLHYSSCKTPSLLRFVGKSEELSWKARFFTWFGSPRPYDRHDWMVDRCGQKLVRYVIDYHDDPTAKNFSETRLDVRPAMDTFGAVWDNVRFPFARRLGFLSFPDTNVQ